MRVKVCGITRIDQLNRLNEIGVDFAGFIFYPASPRFVVPHLPAKTVCTTEMRTKKVGVFVNATYEEIMQQVEAYGLDMVQLHGDETPEDCFRVLKAISTIKAFRVSDQAPLQQNLDAFKDAAHYFLFDTHGKQYGGTGEQFDWNTLNEIEFSNPFFLSGGIGVDDVSNVQALKNTNIDKKLYALDVNSKFETSPGVKDLSKIESLLTQLRIGYSI